MPPVIPVTDNNNYETGEGTVRLRAWVGHNQFGTISAWLNNGPLATSASIDLPIGEAADIRGQSLLIICTVQDIMSNTNTTSLTIELGDSENGATYPYVQDVSVNGGAVIYQITITLN